MIYMVECAFSDGSREAEWNEYYSGQKIDEVLSVPGFRTSQRFKALGSGLAPYIALHSVDSLDVLTSDAYRNRGGGHFDQEFQPYIMHWRRSFYTGLDRAPAIGVDEVLAVTDQPDEVDGIPLKFLWLKNAGLDAPESQRGIAQLSRTQAAEIARDHQTTIRLYAPMMPQRQEPPGKPAR